MPEARRTRRRTLHSKAILAQFMGNRHKHGKADAWQAHRWHQEQLHSRRSPMPLSALDAAAELHPMTQGLPARGDVLVCVFVLEWGARIFFFTNKKRGEVPTAETQDEEVARWTRRKTDEEIKGPDMKTCCQDVNREQQEKRVRRSRE